MTIYKVWVNYIDDREFTKLFSTKEAAMECFDSYARHSKNLAYATVTPMKECKDKSFADCDDIAGLQPPYLPGPHMWKAD